MDSLLFPQRVLVTILNWMSITLLPLFLLTFWLSELPLDSPVMLYLYHSRDSLAHTYPKFSKLLPQIISEAFEP